MSADKLRSLIEKGNYLSLELISDSLVNLLKEVSSLLVDQQRQIDGLKIELRKKLPSQDLTDFKTEYQTRSNLVDQKISDNEKLLNENNERLEERLVQVQSSLTNHVDESIQNLNQQYEGQLSQLESDNDELDSRVKELEGRLGKLAPIVEQSEHCLLNLSTKFDKFENYSIPEMDISSTASVTSVGVVEDGASSMMKGKSVDQIRKINDILRRMGEKVEEHTFSISQIQDTLSAPKEENNKLDSHQDELIAKMIDKRIAEMNAKISQIEAKFEDQSNKLLSRLERKANTDLVERLFEKLRNLISTLKDDIEAIGKRTENFVNKKYVEERISEEITKLYQEEESSMLNKPFKCLACGRPKLRITQPNVEVKLTDLPVILLPYQPT